MYIQVLGSAAGGGFPQWNCNCVNCKGFRDGSLRAQARARLEVARERGPLFDSEGFTRSFEALLATMVNRQRAGQAASPLLADASHTV